MTTKVYPNRYERAKDLGKLGYALSQNIYAPGLYEVRKPDGTKYTIDAIRETCTCPATVPDCAHRIWLDYCQRFAAALNAHRRCRPMISPARRNRASRHAQAWRRANQPAPMPIAKPLTVSVLDEIDFDGSKVLEAVDKALCAYVDAEKAKYAGITDGKAEDTYVCRLEDMEKASGYGFLDCRSAIEWGHGPDSLVRLVRQLRGDAERAAA